MSAPPPMPFFGGKQRIADDIVALFPDHLHYIEPYAGGLSVFLAKPRSRMETINDLDGDLINFWRVLRDRGDELVAAATLTPHSRDELRQARRRDDDPDDLERARRVWVELTQGRSAKIGTGWRFYLDGAATSSPMNRYLAGYVRRMPPTAARLAEVALECRPALDVILDYGAFPDNLLYVDPPYLGSTRKSGGYRHEMRDDRQHRDLLTALAACRARVVLSGYASDLYDTTLAGWHRTTIAASTCQQAGRRDTDRVEVVWTNYEPIPNLFSEEAS